MLALTTTRKQCDFQAISRIGETGSKTRENPHDAWQAKQRSYRLATASNEERQQTRELYAGAGSGRWSSPEAQALCAVARRPLSREAVAQRVPVTNAELF